MGLFLVVGHTYGPVVPQVTSMTHIMCKMMFLLNIAWHLDCIPLCSPFFLSTLTKGDLVCGYHPAWAKDIKRPSSGSSGSSLWLQVAGCCTLNLNGLEKTKTSRNTVICAMRSSPQSAGPSQPPPLRAQPPGLRNDVCQHRSADRRTDARPAEKSGLKRRMMGYY